jgi:cell division protein FtsB
MRWLPITLAALLILIQYPLWLGKGGWLRVWELDRQLEVHRQANHRLEQRNTALEGEVRDLNQGLLAIEERARYELGMVRPDELFVQINPAVGAASGRAPALQPASNTGSSGLKTETAQLWVGSAREPGAAKLARH